MTNECLNAEGHEKPVLEIPSHFHGTAVWNKFLTDSLIESELFRIVHGDFPQVPRGRRFRKNWSFLRLDGQLIGVDTWDREAPTNLGADVLNQVDLILKIEYRESPFWKEIEQRHNLIIRPWTMFGYDAFPTQAFTWASGEHKYIGGFSGDHKRSKRRWIKKMSELGWPVYGVQTVEEFMPLLQECRWGVVLQGLKGKYCDGKNRREHFFSSLGMPLALNYRPTYPFPMREGIEYVYLASPTGLEKLRDIDPAPFAEASRLLWKEYFSPKGMGNMLLEIVDKNLKATDDIVPRRVESSGDGGLIDSRYPAVVCWTSCSSLIGSSKAALRIQSCS